jgi:hypothetical protein
LSFDLLRLAGKLRGSAEERKALRYEYEAAELPFHPLLSKARTPGPKWSFVRRSA